MKRILITGVLICLVCIHYVSGQSPEGIITYELRINLHRNLPAGQEDMKSMVPEFRTDKTQLFFTTHESLYKQLGEDEEEDFNSSGMHIRSGIPNRVTYTDQANARQLTQQEFMGKNYLIEDTLTIAPWKFGTETKTILGYQCQQAYYTDELQGRKQEITAWYTSQIRPFLGPEKFNSLPGAVLAVDINNEERVIVATHIELRPLKKNELKAPRSGSKITREEFRKAMDEQMEQMRRNGRNMIIRN